MKNISGKILLLILLGSVLAADAASATSSSPGAYGVDTIAGYGTTLTTSKTFPEKEMFFIVKKPDGTKLSIASKTGADGIAKIDLYDYHTRKAGVYEVSAYLKDYPADGVTSYFKVYPGDISPDVSEVNILRSVIKADGKDAAPIKVKITDQYGNVFKGHSVRLVSSRSADTVISTSGGVSGETGEIEFKVYSKEPGISILSVVDTTSGTVLSKRAEIAFLNETGYLDSAGGHLDYFIPVASAQDAGPLNKFSISGIPETVEANTNISFTVTAQDQNGLTVQNYTGTVHFSVEGSSGVNVTLPEDYTFKAEDLGKHEFSLGLKFTETGTYKLVVTDIANTAVKGDINVAVGGSTTVITQTGDKPLITSPVEGTYSQNTQTVAGSAESMATVKIFDNDQEIGMTQTDASGSFSFQTNPLADGDHELYVVWLDDANEVKGTSDTVEFTIDTKAPEVEDIVIDPSAGIKAGDVINVKVYTEKGLSDAALIFNLDIYQLSPGLEEEGLYLASFQAPAVAGEYPLDVLLIDELGNEATYQGMATISIAENGEGSVTEEEIPETDGGEVSTTESQPPSQVFGLIAYGSDKRVTLVWEAATDDGIVDHYKIYYGEDPLNLNNMVETQDASTTWYVPALENGKEYYFAVSAVDDAGTESLFTSELESAIPFTLEIETAVTERPDEALSAGAEDAYLRGAAIESRAPSEMVKNGPELIWLLAGTGVLSGLTQKIRRKKKLF